MYPLCFEEKQMVSRKNKGLIVASECSKLLSCSGQCRVQMSFKDGSVKWHVQSFEIRTIVSFLPRAMLVLSLKLKIWLGFQISST